MLPQKSRIQLPSTYTLVGKMRTWSCLFLCENSVFILIEFSKTCSSTVTFLIQIWFIFFFWQWGKISPTTHLGILNKYSDYKYFYIRIKHCSFLFCTYLFGKSNGIIGMQWNYIQMQVTLLQDYETVYRIIFNNLCPCSCYVF